MTLFSFSVLFHQSIFIFDASNFKLKEQFLLSDISAISVSHLTDGVVVISLPTEGPNAKGDVILETDRVIELVVKLALFSNMLEKVNIVSTGE